MLKQGTENVIKAVFPFLVPVVRKYRKAQDINKENNYRKDSFSNPESIGYPLSSMRVHGTYDKSEMSLKLYHAFANAIGPSNCLPDEAYQIEGMSGRAFRNLLSKLANSVEGARYLEIGSWKGSTVTAALFGNTCNALCIDNWSQFGGPKDEFSQNLHNFQIEERVKFIEEDFRKIDYSDIGEFNLYFFDGPHEELDHYDGIIIPQPALKQEYLLLIDDWNSTKVRTGTFRALSASRSKIQFAIEILTAEKDNTHLERTRQHSEWHNGAFLAVVEKGA